MRHIFLIYYRYNQSFKIIMCLYSMMKEKEEDILLIVVQANAEVGAKINHDQYFSGLITNFCLIQGEGIYVNEIFC